MSSAIDAQFHRAVDIVQSLPKGGPVQTSYEEKLGLYSLYKQSTEGDIAIPRPGILDMLGRAKWDSWNQQKGKAKEAAKGEYVAALLKILQKFSDRETARKHISELEAYGGDIERPDRPVSPSSSTSSAYHSSQAPSPPSSPPPQLSDSRASSSFAPPDPALPPPDVSPDIIPPSALNASHRSLLNLAESAYTPDPAYPAVPAGMSGIMPLSALPPSRAHSLAAGRGGSGGDHVRKQSAPSLRHWPHTPLSGAGPSGLGFTTSNAKAEASDQPFPPSPQVLSRDYTQTPELINPSPYLGLGATTHPYLYPTANAPPPRPGSTSTFAAYPPPSLNLPQTLQQIQTSLTALHERMSTLERTQAVILRRDERRRGWFWGSSEERELEEVEDEAERARWRTSGTGPVGRPGRRGKRGFGVRIGWVVLLALRRAMVDLGVWLMIATIAVLFVPGGVRRGRGALARLRARAQAFLHEVAS